jgi:hypothetical protein
MNHPNSLRTFSKVKYRRFMKTCFAATRSHSERKELGFTLVITLMLMVLLTLVTVGLLSLSSVAIRGASIEGSQQIARANARLALMIALGELQTHLGPDARISARAETLGMDPRAGGSVAANTPQAWWVGVSHSDGVTPVSPSKDIAWLISGLNGSGPGSSLNDPVRIIGGGTLDLGAYTGGKNIEAGRVEITDGSRGVTGAYAWFVDDNGMKAQLKASHPEVRNDHPSNFSGGVLPASYQPGILDRMGALGNATHAEIQRLLSPRDLELLGVDRAVVQNKFFGYTTRSHGVLADVKNGGLKKDLSVPFDWPDSQVFDRVFPRSDPQRFLLLDRAKLAQAPELNKENGYINMAIFRDYFNLKNHLRTHSGTGIVSLAATTFQKAGFLGGTEAGAYNGAFGPHSGNWGALREFHAGMPYGIYQVYIDAVNYRDNPITPVLSSLQQNAWITDQGGSPNKIRTHVQMFSSHYNPYNVGIILDGDNPVNHTGPRILSYPQVKFTMSGTGVSAAVNGLDGKLEAHARGGLVIPPGRSQVLGFRSSALRGGEIDQQLYSPNVAALTVESVYQDHNGAITSSSTADVDFILTRFNILHGADERNGDREVSQVIYAPFSWDRVDNRPAKTVRLSAPLGVNNVARNAFYLRTTRESKSRIRPLVDANIRAIFNNPRWDSPLNLSMLASHSEDSGTPPTSSMPPMSTAPNGHGFTYLGADRDPYDGHDRVILFDVARKDLVSLGQLQHASAGRFSYEPSYIVGNSYANPRLPLKEWRGNVTDTFSPPRQLPSAGSFVLFDASYLVNERLWDEYIFTTIPQSNPGLSASAAAALLARNSFLPNPRFIPYVPRGSSFTVEVLSDAGAGGGAGGSYADMTGSFYHNAGHLLVDGQFNVNSTSVDAWEAFLSGTHELPVGRINASGAVAGLGIKTGGVRFPRASSHLGEGMKTSNIDENYWIGFRELTRQEVRDIAEEIVKGIKRRGAFLTLGQFVNRRLEDSELGKSGVLQAALDASVNKGLSRDYESPAGGYNQISAGSTQGAGFPGQLLQGDILQALSPFMTVRSDTFTIRGYGEARNPANGSITATAYCEAVVQRFPDPLIPNVAGKSALEELAFPSSPFGRSFSIVSFRWLAREEI